jgi:ceramide glucosyltransferase
VIYILYAVCAVAAAYQAVAIAACVWHVRRPRPRASDLPPVSSLKPVHGLEPGLRDAIESHLAQDYPAFELLLGIRDQSSPAGREVARIVAEHPAAPVRAVRVTTCAPNGKVGALIDMAREAHAPVIVVNDSDVIAPPHYLRDVIAELQPGVGLVTCIYNARAKSLLGIFEALGVDTDFAPSALVAPFVGISEFG